MKESFNFELSSWNWRAQTVWEWEDAIPIWVILNKIENWFYQSREVEIDLSVINLTNYNFTINDLFDFITHYKLVERADLKYPVIVDKKWRIIDWRHRLCKAIIEWKKTLKWIMIIDSTVV